MNKILLTIIVCFLVISQVSAQFIDSSDDRVKTYLDIPFKRIGTITPNNVSEIEASNWTIGCEVLDRDYANYDSYKDYLPVWVDLFSGRIYKIPASNWSKNGAEYKFQIPVYDSPVLIADFSLIKY